MQLTELKQRLEGHVAPEAESPPSRRSAVAMLMRPGEQGPEVLLMVRAEHPDDPWSGQVGLPGGRREDFDADLRATAQRETEEEVGVALGEVAEFLCRLESIQARARGRKIEMDVTPFAYWTTETIETTLNYEVAEVFWLPLERAASGELDGEYPYEKDGTRYRLPCWKFEGRTIWGLTFRMLSGLLGLTR